MQRIEQTTLTIRVPVYLREILKLLAKNERVPESEVVREAIRRYISIYRFHQLRHKVLPFAEVEGLLTDEDVYRNLK